MKIFRKIFVALFAIFFTFSANVFAYTMYALDGRQINISYNDADTWRKVGWYDAPVTLMRTADGRTAVVYQKDVSAWERVGWFDANKTVKIYAPDGRTAQIPAYQLQAYKNLGWYDYPVYACYPGTNIPKYEAITGIYPSESIGGTYYYSYIEGMMDKTDEYCKYLESIGFIEDSSYVDDFWDYVAIYGLTMAWLPVGRYVKGQSAVCIDYNRMTGQSSVSLE